jgi:hypothetical protein
MGVVYHKQHSTNYNCGRAISEKALQNPVNSMELFHVHREMEIRETIGISAYL